MFWRILTLTLFVAGALAQYEVTDERRQQFKAMITEYCKKNGAENKANDVEKSVNDFINCVKGLFDLETIKQEIQDAKPNGALDEVFKKYCAKSPELKSCIHTLTDGVAPCTEASVRERINDFNNATDHLIDFVCYKDGDRIALFIAEGGPECFQEKANQIRMCAMKLKEEIPDVDSARKLTIETQCSKLDELSNCIVKALEGCNTPTPGNMAEALFKYVRNGSPCKK